jgi:hypothetical protein
MNFNLIRDGRTMGDYRYIIITLFSSIVHRQGRSDQGVSNYIRGQGQVRGKDQGTVELRSVA